MTATLDEVIGTKFYLLSLMVLAASCVSAATLAVQQGQYAIALALVITFVVVFVAAIAIGRATKGGRLRATV